MAVVVLLAVVPLPIVIRPAAVPFLVRQVLVVPGSRPVVLIAPPSVALVSVPLVPARPVLVPVGFGVGPGPDPPPAVGVTPLVLLAGLVRARRPATRLAAGVRGPGPARPAG